MYPILTSWRPFGYLSELIGSPDFIMLKMEQTRVFREWWSMWFDITIHLVAVFLQSSGTASSYIKLNTNGRINGLGL
jgi:hypothetical protein